jgi:hypothetical protein
MSAQDTRDVQPQLKARCGAGLTHDDGIDPVGKEVGGNAPSTEATPSADANSAAEQNSDEPPNGGYGWVCVACGFWINAHTWGLNSVTFALSL